VPVCSAGIKYVCSVLSC